MSKFTFNGLASIQHMNTRKQGPEDDKELAVDIKLATQTTSSICGIFDTNLESFLFFDDTGAVRNEFQEPIAYKYELLNYVMETPGMSFSGVSIKKISLEPKDGFKINLSFQVSFKPLSNQVALFAEYLQEMMPIKLVPINEELDLG